MKLTICCPEGLKQSEIKAISTLKENLRDSWHGYASFLVNDGQGSMEIDLLLITHDRFILCEIKEWSGTINSDGKNWEQSFPSGKTRRQKSPVYIKREHAQRLRSLFTSELKALWGCFYTVEHAIILSGDAIIQNMPEQERLVVFTLDEFLKISSAKGYNQIVPERESSDYLFNKNKLRRPNSERQLAIFNNWFNGGDVFKLRQRVIDGYILPESKNASFAHPKGFYSEYTGDHSETNKVKALMRCWDFSQLGPHAMEQGQRANLGLRERRVVDYVGGEAPQVKKDYLMQPRHSAVEGEIEEDFTEVYEHPPLLVRLDEYLTEVPFTVEARLSLLRSLLTPFVELHNLEIAHRDVALERLWFDKNSQAIIVSGLIAARFPEQGSSQSVGDLREMLASNSMPLPEEKMGEENINAICIDVYQLGALAYQIAFDEKLSGDDIALAWHTPAVDLYEGALEKWIKKAINIEPESRFSSATEMLNELALATILPSDVSKQEEIKIMDALGEFVCPNIIPFVEWAPVTAPEQNLTIGRVSYLSVHEGQKVIVKIWNQLIPTPQQVGKNRRILSFLKKCQAVQKSRIRTQPVVRFGWSQSGLFLVSEYVEGVGLEDFISSERTSEETLLQRLELAEKLVSLIKRLHDSELTHGDLKPENILVTQSESAPEGESNLELYLIDCLDVNLFGEYLENNEYAPKKQVGSTARDIYACYLIVDELFGGCGGFSNKIRAEIARALGNDLQKIPVSLSPLQDSLDLARLMPEEEVKKTLTICYHDASLPETTKAFIPYDGLTALSVNVPKGTEGELRVYLTGKKEKITLFLEYRDNTLQLKKKNSRVIAPAEVIKEFRSYKTSKYGDVIRSQIFFRNAIGSNKELSDFLLGLPLVQKALSISSEDESQLAYTDTTSKDLTTIWRALLQAEHNLHPKVTVGGDIDTAGCGSFKVPINEDFSWYDYGSQDTIQVTDGDLEQPWIYGTLKIRDCTNDTLMVEGRLPKPGRLRPNTQLQLQEHRTVVSWQRRKKALQRVLRNEAVIPDLVRHFSTANDREHVGNIDLPEPPAEIWNNYEKFLDESKLTALRKVLSGPLNVIVGPPGTGKTTLLAYLLGYLNRLPNIKRILLVSQSHVAVNEVALKARQVIKESLKSDDNFESEMVRLGDKEKVCEGLLDIHIDALQSQYRTSFHRDFESRLLCLAPRLNLPKDFILAVAAMYRDIGNDITQYTQLKLNQPSNGSEKQLHKLHSRLSTKIKQFTDETEAVLFDVSPQRKIIGLIAAQHGINNPKKLEKLNELLKIIHQWYQRLSADSDGFAGFMARTRKLVIGTLVGIGKSAYDIASHEYDIAIVDEAGRASASELAMAMQSAHRVILVGDHNQLPPHYEKETLDKVQMELGVSADVLQMTDFERAYSATNGIMLDTQYRMEKPIGDIVSAVFYNGELKTGTKEVKEDLSVLPFPWDRSVTWLDTGSQDTGERKSENSFVNSYEIELICGHLKRISEDDASLKILRNWAKNDSHPPIGIITGYSQQVKLLRERLENDPWAASIRNMIKVDTIDSYQGSENRIIILSLVRNNLQKRTGFMNDNPRINVALSRARNRLVIIGAVSMWKTASRDAPMSKVLEFITERCNAEHDCYQIVPCEQLP